MDGKTEGARALTVERRSHARYNAIERVTAIIGQGVAVPCIMTNISAKGARICFPVQRRVPRRFHIVFRTGRRSGVRFVWQRGSAVGVEFDDRAQLVDWLVLRVLFRIDAWAEP